MQHEYKSLFLDLSGVIYEGDSLLAGAREAVERARDSGLVLRFVTNTATSSREMLHDKLQRMGIDVEQDELFTAPEAARRYLLRHDLRPYCLVHEAIRHEFDNLDQSQPNCVLLGDARGGLHYDSLNHAFKLCMQEAPLIGIGMNRYFMDESGLNLDAGPFIRALEWAAGVEAIIMGKPSRAFFDEVVASTPFTASQCMMVGDDIDGDVIGAVDAGLQACLVKTGKFQPGDEQRLPAGALVADSLSALLT